MSMLRRHCTAAIAPRLLAFASLALCGMHVHAADPSEPRPVQLQEMVVTGSRLPAVAEQSAQDVRIYERERIEKSGQSTVTQYLQTLPEVSLVAAENTTTGTVRLRGAIFGSPLVLINGRRTEPVSGSAALFGFFDLNTLPLSLVERIEVLPTGSSAIYGGDALAGVVNIVLRSDLKGAEGGVGYRWAKGTDETHIWAGGGWKSENSSITIMATAMHRTPLMGSERDITNDPDLRRFGGPNLGTPAFGVPATVFSASGNLPGLNSNTAAVPRGSSGVGLTPADFAATAGMQNTGSFNRWQAMIPETDRSGVFLSGKHRVTTDMELFAELLVTQYKNEGLNSPPTLSLTTVPASNAFNPFGANVRVSGLVQGAETAVVFTLDEQFVRPLVGMRGKLDAWQWEVTALDARDNGSQVLTGQPNSAARTAALASSDPATALNPFRDGPWASPSLLASIYNASSVTDYSSESRILDAFARGPLARLPAGPLNAVFGAEHEASSFERGTTTSRTARAFFGELRVPLYAAADGKGGRREVLAVQGAARYDDYSDFGSKTTGQVGTELRPSERLLLRGTYATAFKPPTLFNLGAPQTSSVLAVNDPKNGGAAVLARSITGGNPDLHPTTAASATLGFVWSPERVRGLDVSMTRWWSRIEDAINFPISSQFVIDNEGDFPGRVIRDSSGQIVAVNRTYANFGTMREDGVDVAINWRIGTRSFGTFTPGLAGTYITQFEGSSTAGSPSVNRLSRANNDGVFAPRWKSIASLAWAPNAAWNVWLAGRYISSYTDYTPPRQIGDVWYFDASLDVAVERALDLTKGSLGGMALSLSGTNLTNKLPDWSTFFRGYDVFNYDLVGRTLFVRVKFQI